MATKRVKRLTPLPETLRELFLKSGNCCAYPGCQRLMMNHDGIFIGQVCHIEAAEDGGERFNPGQTNEQRRNFSNLLLMCYEHHTITNDVAKYAVALLQRMKANHEAKFTDVAKAIEDSITDSSAQKQPQTPKTLKRMSEVLRWGLTSDEIAISLPELLSIIDRVQKLPIRTRQLLTIIVSRLTRRQLPGDRYRFDNRVPQMEIAEAANLSMEKVEGHMQIIERYKLGLLDCEQACMTIILWECPSGWNVWGDFNEFCSITGIPLKGLLVDLRFDLLD